ncbi:PREDICTED: excitatory amino acid transporter 5-like [Poecilia mexicana]|nr:PREDICTED: excitatory amino acid transporter 5-like [Poecilia mexicana]
MNLSLLCPVLCSWQEVKYFQFPGELLMRMLKMLILPLVVSSLMSGLAALDAKCSSRLGLITVSYYLWTTFVAVIVGIMMVSIIHPGGAAQKEDSEDSGKHIMSSADALLDLIRNMFPSNLVQATFQQYQTRSQLIVKPKPTVSQAQSESTTRRPLIYGIQDDNGSDIQNFALDLTPPPDVLVRTREGTSDGMNVLGIVIFSATMGIMLGRMGPNGSALVNFCQSLNEAVLRIVAIVIWYFPFGIVFLVAGKILEMSDPSAMGKKLGFYAITVVFGLVLHGLFILPAMYFFITKKSPIVYIRGILQALLIALATSSSSATLPITFKCLLENNHIDRRIIRFVLPVGATINMDGTALYEAVAAIFIAQVNNYELDFGQIITISWCTLRPARYFPFGIVFLVAGKILEMSDPSAMGKKLGFYAITVVFGLVLHGLFILPAMYFFITKKSPIVYIRGILQALLIALATSSSSATLPITFKCLLENNHIDRRIIRFVLPVGATINMDGTALYEAVAAIFIAQVNNYELDFGQIITISITATAASIGAAGIPQAGLVTMVIVLTSVGLPTDDITLIIAVDWALDRFRTMVNVMGDALATGIMAHICRKDFMKEGDGVPLVCEAKIPLNPPPTMNCHNNNGNVRPPSSGVKHKLIPPDVARLMQLEEGVQQISDKKKPPIPPRYLKKSKEHCTIDMNGLETNV